MVDRESFECVSGSGLEVEVIYVVREARSILSWTAV